MQMSQPAAPGADKACKIPDHRITHQASAPNARVTVELPSTNQKIVRAIWYSADRSEPGADLVLGAYSSSFAGLSGMSVGSYQSSRVMTRLRNDAAARCADGPVPDAVDDLNQGGRTGMGFDVKHTHSLSRKIFRRSLTATVGFAVPQAGQASPACGMFSQ